MITAHGFMMRRLGGGIGLTRMLKTTIPSARMLTLQIIP